MTDDEKRDLECNPVALQPLPPLPPEVQRPRAIATTQQSQESYDPRAGLVPQSFSELRRMSEIFANSQLIPKHFQKCPDDCFVALQMAYRMGLDPLTALQNMFVVSGRPGMSAQLCIALANRSGIFKGPLEFEVIGKKSDANLSVTCFGELAKTGRRVEFTVDMAMAKAENWTKNPKYQSMPELMLRYRAATLLIRTTCPEVIVGMHTVDELEDVSASTRPQATGGAQEVLAAITQGK